MTILIVKTALTQRLRIKGQPRVFWSEDYEALLRPSMNCCFWVAGRVFWTCKSPLNEFIRGSGPLEYFGPGKRKNGILNGGAPRPAR